MSLPFSARSELISFSPTSIPLSEDGFVLADLWVELPRNHRFIRYVCAGESLTRRHFEVLAKHVSKNVFMRLVDLERSPNLSSELSPAFPGLDGLDLAAKGLFLPSAKVASATTRPAPSSSPDTLFSATLPTTSNSEAALSFSRASEEFLAKPIAQELKKIYSELALPSLTQISLESSPIAELAKKLARVIAPETDKLRDYLKSVPQYVGVMNDSAAISVLATLFALATGQNSRSVFRDLAYASLFMDISLADFDDETHKTFYLDFEKLSAADRATALNHPKRALELVNQRFRDLPDLVSQLIIGHHELFNGKGYPRRVRSESLAPLVRVLAFAVDVFAFMKQQQLQGETCNLSEAVEYYVHEPVEKHERRHATPLCKEIAEYLAEDRRLNEKKGAA